MKAQQKKLSGCASNLLAHEDLGNFEEAHHWNMWSKFYNEKVPLVYESDKIGDPLSWRSGCYFEAQVWKKDSNISPSHFFSHFFVWALWPLFLFGLLWPLFIISKSPSFFPHMGQCSNNDDHHTFIYLQLKNYNSILELRYDSIWMPPVVYRDVQWSRVTCIKNMNGGLATNTMPTKWSCKAIWKWWYVS